MPRNRHVVNVTDIENRVPQVFNCVDTPSMKTNGRLYFLPQLPDVIPICKLWRVYYSPTLFETPARNITNDPQVYCVASVDAYDDEDTNPVFHITYYNKWMYSDASFNYLVAPYNLYNLAQCAEYISARIALYPISDIPTMLQVRASEITADNINTVIEIEKGW